VSLLRGGKNRRELAFVYKAAAKDGVQGRLLRGLAADVVQPMVPKARVGNGQNSSIAVGIIDRSLLGFISRGEVGGLGPGRLASRLTLTAIQDARAPGPRAGGQSEHDKPRCESGRENFLILL
jgi:hypothetical protein